MIRNLIKEDIPKVNELGKELYDNFENIYNLEEYITNNKYLMFVNEDEDINAFLIAYNNIDEYELLCIVVDKEYQGQGIGTKVMDYFIKKTNKPIILEVSDKNIKAINLYKRHGFKEISVRKNYYKDSNALIMKLVIE